MHLGVPEPDVLVPPPCFDGGCKCTLLLNRTPHIPYTPHFTALNLDCTVLPMPVRYGAYGSFGGVPEPDVLVPPPRFQDGGCEVTLHRFVRSPHIDRGSELGTHKTVKARFWPWLSFVSPYILSSCSRPARQRIGVPEQARTRLSHPPAFRVGGVRNEA